MDENTYGFGILDEAQRIEVAKNLKIGSGCFLEDLGLAAFRIVLRHPKEETEEEWNNIPASTEVPKPL